MTTLADELTQAAGRCAGVEMEDLLLRAAARIRDVEQYLRCIDRAAQVGPSIYFHSLRDEVKALVHAALPQPPAPKEAQDD